MEASPLLDTVQPLTNDEIKTAVEELNRSTENITKQTGLLRQQQEALARLVKTHGQCSEMRRDADLKQLQKWETSRDHLSAEVSSRLR